MELSNRFRVSVPVEEAWKVLTDLEQIAPCMPGAQLLEVEGDDYRGIVKVKVGPITTQYKGVARIVEQDELTHRAVLRAEGHETKGQGNASATVTAMLMPDGDGTSVSIVTDLSITGKVAQFGRGVIGDVSSKLLDQFARQLEADVIAASAAPKPAARDTTAPAQDTTAPAASPKVAAKGTTVPAEGTTKPAEGPASTTKPAEGPTSTTEPAIRQIRSAPPEPVNLIGAAGGSVAKRAAPAAIVAVALVAGSIVWRRYRRAR